MGRFVGKFIEERAAVSTDIINKVKRLKQLKAAIAKAGAATRIVCDEFKEEIKSIRSSIKAIKSSRYKATVGYKYKVAGATVQETPWQYTPVKAADLVTAVSKITPKRMERYNRRTIVPTKKEVNGIKYTTLNGVFTKDTINAISASTKDPARYYQYKKPRNMTHHVGVEMEMVLHNCTNDQLSKLLTKYSLHSKVNITTDGSVHGHDVGAKGDAELRIIDTQSDINQTISQLCEMLADEKIKADVYHKCGLHIHLDMRKRIAYDAYRNLVNCLPALRKLTPKDRRINKFCKDNKSNDLYKTLENLDQHGHDRYWAINPLSLRNHNTLEVRMQHGSVDAYEINGWINLLTTIVSAPPILRVVSSLDDLCFVLKLDNDMTKYVLSTGEKHEVSGLVFKAGPTSDTVFDAVLTREHLTSFVSAGTAVTIGGR